MDVTDKLQNTPLEKVPQQEVEVIFLFSQIFKNYGFTQIKKIQTNRFPDCIAYRKTNSGLKEVRIEFEHESINFNTHGHNPKECDCIVCWEHNWYDKPENLEVIELREHYGYSRKIWVMAVGNDYKAELQSSDNHSWSVPSKSHSGDIVLFYHNAPESYIKDIFVIKGQYSKEKSGDWTVRENDIYANIQRIAELHSPIFFQDLKNDNLLSKSKMIRKNMQGRINVTKEDWQRLYDLMIKKNPGIEGELSKFSPQEIY